MKPANLLADLEEFVHDHRPHGPLTADATEPAWNGYQLTVACPCGVTLERWTTPLDGELGLLTGGGRMDLCRRTIPKYGDVADTRAVIDWLLRERGQPIELDLRPLRTTAQGLWQTSASL